MKPVFPLDDVDVRRVKQVSRVKNPSFQNDWMAISDSEFWLSVKGIGEFYAATGSRAEFSPDPGVSISSIELYLNGSVYGAILHQRRILPLHGSSFVYRGAGVMLCGDSGAGKSSLTTAFCLAGAKFLTDDVSPIQLKDGVVHVLSKSDRLKLWDDSLKQLGREKNKLDRIRPEDDKFYFTLDDQPQKSHPLNLILILSIDEVENAEFEPVSGAVAFAVVHDEIYRLYYLSSMPEVLKSYVSVVAAIADQCRIIRVKRPAGIPIRKMKDQLSDYLDQLINNDL